MLDQLLLDRFEKLLSVKLSERRKQLPYQLMQIDNRATKSGAYHSSARLQHINRAYEQELSIRTILAWEGLVRVHRTLGCPMSDTLRDDLKTEVFRVINLTFSELSAELQRVKRKSSMNIGLSLDRSQLLWQYWWVQTGINAVANVIQNLGDDDRSKLSVALVQVRDSIVQDLSLPDQQRQELMEIANECSAQINSESPNNTKLLSMLNLLRTTVQTIASAGPAYQAVKIALLPLGISLP